MKHIYFIRHAKSSWSTQVQKDIDRPLNQRGKRDAPFMADMLVKKGVQIDGIIKSPAQRITETVIPFIKAFSIEEENVLTENQIYEGSIYDILDVVHSAVEDWESIMIFGHNPAMSYVADYFGGKDVVSMPTCGILKVKSKAKDWAAVNASNSKITSFYYPKLFLNA